MRKSTPKPRRKKAPKRVSALPDLEQSKAAVLNSLTSASGQRTCDHAIREFAAHDLRRTCARLCHLAGGELDQSQFLLGHVSIQTTPPGVIHHGLVTSPGGRRALALIVHDAARPRSHDVANPPPLVPCK